MTIKKKKKIIIFSGAIETSVDQNSSTAAGRVMIQQADGSQQQATVLTSGSLSQNAVLNIPNLPTVVTMPMAGSSTSTTTGNVTAGASPTNVVSTTNTTPAMASTITTQQVWTHCTSRYG